MYIFNNNNNQVNDQGLSPLDHQVQEKEILIKSRPRHPIGILTWTLALDILQPLKLK